MMQTTLLRGRVLTAALVALCAAIGPQALQAKPHDRKFKGTESSVLVSEAPSSSCAPGQVLVQIEGQGVATHLGAYALVRQHCFDFTLSTIQAGTFTFTRKNGHQLSGAYGGMLVTAPDGLILIDVSWEITGGTGGFAGASGTGLSQGTFDPATLAAEIDHLGVITY